MLISLMLSGCAFYRVTEIHINGKNIKSAYANGDADILYKACTGAQIWK